MPKKVRASQKLLPRPSHTHCFDPACSASVDRAWSQQTKAKRGGKEWRELLCHGLEMSASERGSGSARGISIELMSWGGGYCGQLGVKLPGANPVSFMPAKLPHVTCLANRLVHGVTMRG